jgi:hypothetical protein
MPRRVRPRAVTVSALAAAGLLSLANGALTGVGSAAPAPAVPPDTPATASLPVSCPFAAPLGARDLTVEAATTLPAHATTGMSASLGGFSLKFTLPRDLALSFFPAGTTTGALQGVVRLDLAVHQNDQADKIPLTLTVGATPLPDAGDVTLTATGTVPDVAINTVGTLSFDLTAPALALAAVPPAGAAAATEPVTPVACTAAPDAQATLGKILVLPKTEPGTGAKPQAAPGEVQLQDDPPDPDNEYTQPLGLITVLTKSTVAKLGATVTSDPAFLFNGFFTVNLITGNSRISGATVFNPATTSFLGFGFVPVSATVEFLPVDYRNGKLIELGGGLSPDPVTGETTLTTTLQVMARLSNAKVNGVPLELGSDCVTAEPVTLTLSGPYDPFSIGHIRTDPEKGFRLPAFTGCGDGSQDLSPLLTGMSSGDGNQAFVDTYNLIGCSEPDHTQCPPESVPPLPGAAGAAAKKAVTQKAGPTPH